KAVIYSLVFVELLQVLFVFGAGWNGYGELAGTLTSVSILHLLFSVGALVLVHNLYVGAAPAARRALRWPAAAMAAMWLFDLNFYTLAHLSGAIPALLAETRGVLLLAMVALLAIGSVRTSMAAQFRPSRSVTFQSASLLLIGGYLAGMVLVAQGLSSMGGEVWRLIQIAFVVFASTVAIFLLPSKKLRAWVRVTLAKHLFQHRYDYREEWLRLTGTIGKGGENALPLHERVVQSMADITDSPGGLLLAPAEDERLVLDARWQWPGISVPAAPFPKDLAFKLQEADYVVDLDLTRAGRDEAVSAASLPEWLRVSQDSWALVPLIHFGRLVGIVVLARPELPHRLDWEDFDLLRVVGRQLASYLAEQAGQEKLGEAHRFDEFNRRIAFVMHDIKNLASQLSLLARNAEKHADNPEFRRDMLVTLTNSADKLNALLARLGRYGGSNSEPVRQVDIDDLLRSTAKRFATSGGQVVVASSQPCEVAAQPEALEQALAHLIQNAIDASENGAPVMVSVYGNGSLGTIEITDSGEGMNSEFIRTQLFKPFHSSKPGGFGIGAFEARELIRTMGGRLEVESQEGLGTRFFIRLPRITAATAAMEENAGNEPDDRAEVA
ncbi:MAG TPA: XrtA/PEP-CTERM system histidine kinase PrsK, partial [Alteraurantiacibacter sp.]